MNAPCTPSFPPRARAQRGFTLVELVIVILILGILSAVALPRFISLGSDARRAKAEAMHGSIRAAAQIVRAAALVRGALGAGTETETTGSTPRIHEVQMEDQAVQTNYGYPEASTDGIVVAANINPATDRVSISGSNATAGSTITIAIDGATTPGGCQITYQSPAAANTTPTIVLTTTGC